MHLYDTLWTTEWDNTRKVVPCHAITPLTHSLYAHHQWITWNYYLKVTTTCFIVSFSQTIQCFETMTKQKEYFLRLWRMSRTIFLFPFLVPMSFFFWYHLMPQFHVWSPPTPPSPGSTIHCSFICLTWSPVVCRTFSLHPSSLPAPLDYCLFPWHQQQQNTELEQASTCSSSNGYTTSATSLPPLFLDSFLEPQAGAPFIFGDHSGSNNQNSNHNNNHSNHHTLNHVGSNSYTTTSLPSNHVRLPPFCSIWVTYFISFCQRKVKQKSTLRSQVKNHTDILIFNRCIAN